MKGDNVVSSLIRKRRELGREIRQHEAEIERLRLDAAALDQVLVAIVSHMMAKRIKGATNAGG
jgi:hypothetical protein